MSVPYLDRAANGRFYIHFMSGGRSCRKSTGTDEQAAAEKAFGRWLSGVRDEPAAGVTFADIWPAYFESCRGTPTAIRLRGMAPRLLNYFGGRAVVSLDQDYFDAYLQARLRNGAQLSTARLELTKVLACISHAERARKLPAGERPHIRLPSPPDARDRWLSQDEARRLFAAATSQRADMDKLSRTERFLWIALATGARRRAIETLTWDQIDFETRVIHFARAGSSAAAGKRNASVPISSTLLEILQRAHRERTGQFVLGSSTEAYTGVLRAAREAGLEDVTPHVLRHTAATWMARKGVPLWKIAGILGNTVAMVEQVYAKHSPDDGRAAVEDLRF